MSDSATFAFIQNPSDSKIHLRQIRQTHFILVLFSDQYVVHYTDIISKWLL